MTDITLTKWQSRNMAGMVAPILADILGHHHETTLAFQKVQETGEWSDVQAALSSLRETSANCDMTTFMLLRAEVVDNLVKKLDAEIEHMKQTGDGLH